MPTGDTLLISLTLHQAKLIFLDVAQPFIELIFLFVIIAIVFLAYKLIIFPFFRTKL